MKMLWVGDPHVTPDELADCQSLLDYVYQVALDQKADVVFFAGDLHHTHSVVRLEVSDFWRRNLKRLAQICQVKLLVGNHDQPNDLEKKFHALEQYKDVAQVIDHPTMEEGVLYMPYVRTQEEASNIFQQFASAKTVLCHQSFSGATYENGFTVEHGFEPPQLSVVSGHIHKTQKIGNVWYPGAPRWRTISDASTPTRAIQMLEFDSTGALVASTPFKTNEVCQSMLEIVETENQTEPLFQEGFVGPKTTPVVTLTGSRVWVESRRAFWSQYGAKISTQYTDVQIFSTPESIGPLRGMLNYCAGATPKFGTDKELLKAMINERFNGLAR